MSERVQVRAGVVGRAREFPSDFLATRSVSERPFCCTKFFAGRWPPRVENEDQFLPHRTHHGLNRVRKMTANQQIIDAHNRMSCGIQCVEIFVVRNRWCDRRTQCQPCLGRRVPTASKNGDRDGTSIDQRVTFRRNSNDAVNCRLRSLEKDVQGSVDAVAGVRRITTLERMT